MARSMAKSSTILSTESREGRRGISPQQGRTRRTTTAGRIWEAGGGGGPVVVVVVVGFAKRPLLCVPDLFSLSPSSKGISRRHSGSDYSDLTPWYPRLFTLKIK